MKIIPGILIVSTLVKTLSSWELGNIFAFSPSGKTKNYIFLITMTQSNTFQRKKEKNKWKWYQSLETQAPKPEDPWLTSHPVSKHFKQDIFSFPLSLLLAICIVIFLKKYLYSLYTSFLIFIVWVGNFLELPWWLLLHSFTQNIPRTRCRDSEPVIHWNQWVSLTVL